MPRRCQGTILPEPRRTERRLPRVAAAALASRRAGVDHAWTDHGRDRAPPHPTPDARRGGIFFLRGAPAAPRRHGGGGRPVMTRTFPAMALMLPLAGCAGVQSALDPAGGEADRIHTLSILLFVLS